MKMLKLLFTCAVLTLLCTPTLAAVSGSVRASTALTALTASTSYSVTSAFKPDMAYLQDKQDIENLQKATFRYMWDFAEPVSGMAYEANFDWPVRPVAVGGTGFGIAAIVVATDRGWVSREAALARLLKIALFLRDKTEREDLHGAFPHWINGNTGETIPFGKNDTGADIVETSLLMQGLLIARSYFNGPGEEARLRAIITELWEDVNWNWFTGGEENGLYWHWNAEQGFSGLKILGYNECLITYILALSSPTHPISPAAYAYWHSGKGYQAKKLFGYEVEAALDGGGPLFLAHYSFIGLDPRRMADRFVPGGYFARNVKQTLSNRAYCLENAPAKNGYSPEYWGLTASQTKGGYAASDPLHDFGTVAPAGSLGSLAYTPYYSLQVLRALLHGPAEKRRAGIYKKVWGEYGPYDAFSIREKWVSERYLAIDQLSITCMVENYRSGLLWRTFMQDKEVRIGLQKAGISRPNLQEGFPEAIITMRRKGKRYVPDAFEVSRHPDAGRYVIPFWSAEAGTAVFTFYNSSTGEALHSSMEDCATGRNYLQFYPFQAVDGAVLRLQVTLPSGEERNLPVRLH